MQENNTNLMNSYVFYILMRDNRIGKVNAIQSINFYPGKRWKIKKMKSRKMNSYICMFSLRQLILFDILHLIPRNERKVGCPHGHYSQCYFIHRHPNNAWNNNANSSIVWIISSNGTDCDGRISEELFLLRESNKTTEMERGFDGLTNKITKKFLSSFNDI